MWLCYLYFHLKACIPITIILTLDDFQSLNRLDIGFSLQFSPDHYGDHKNTI